MTKRETRLLAAVKAARKYLENIRYQQWPTIGLGIELLPSELDDLLKELNTAIGTRKEKE